MNPEFTLRQWQRGDEESLAHHANNPKIWNNVRNYFPHPYTIKHAFEWVNYSSEEPNSFAIVVAGNAVGGITLVAKDDIYVKNMEIGYWLGEEFWGRGIMTDAIKRTVVHGFQNSDVHRIYAGIFEYNIASKRALEKAGFEHEATLKQAVFKNGQFWDDLVYTIRRV